MTKTTNIGLNIVSAAEDGKSFLSFRTELAGDGEDSNMVIIDKEIGELKGNTEWRTWAEEP